MTTRINASDKIIGLNGTTLIGLVQNLDYTPGLNAQDIFELGNTAKVDTAYEYEGTGSFEVMDSGALPGILARMNVLRDNSQVVTGYQFASGGAGGKNAYQLAETDMDEMVFDMIEYERTDQQHFNRAVIYPRCFLTGISGRADANGMGTATLNFANDFMFGAPSPYHDHKTTLATRTTATTATTTPITVWTNYAISYVYVNERRFRNVATAPNDSTTVSFTPGTGVITFANGTGSTEGYTIPTDALIRVFLYNTSSPSSTFLSVAAGEQGTTANYLKGYMVSMYIAPAVVTAPTYAEQWLKVQSVDYNIDLRVQVLRQLAYNALGSSVYFRAPTYPFSISCNATVNESDWKDWKATLTKTFPGNDVYNDTYDLAPASLKPSFNIVVVQYTRSGSKLNEIRFTDMRVDGMSKRVNVGGISEISWGFRGTKVTFFGYNN